MEIVFSRPGRAAERSVVKSRTGDWLTSRQRLLLKAALLQGPDSIEAWSRWKQNLDLDRLDRGSLRLLPLLHHNLRRQDISEPLMDKILPLYRLTWLKNKGLFLALAEALETLQQQMIATMVLKGAAVTQLYYLDLGLRPMDDVDVLLKPEQARQGMSVLVKGGWEQTGGPKPPFTKNNTALTKAAQFRNSAGCNLDLHWHVLPEMVRRYGGLCFWEGAEDALVMDVPAKVMNPADLIFHTCVHGREHGSDFIDNALLRMLADIHLIIVAAERTIEWPRLITQARKSHLVLPVQATLRCLKELLGSPVPEAVLEELEGMNLSVMDRITNYSVTSRAKGISRAFSKVLSLLLMYKWMKEDETCASGRIGVLEIIKQRWRLSHKWQIPRTAAIKMFNNLVKHNRD